MSIKKFYTVVIILFC